MDVVDAGGARVRAAEVGCHVRARLPAIEAAVAEGRLSATLAVEEIAAMLGI